MHRHFVTPEQLRQSRLSLGRTDARHLQTVLRIQAGTEIELFDGVGRVVRCQITECNRNGLTLEHIAPPVDIPPLPCRIILCPCVSKNRRMDWTLEKAVELGAGRIIPILSARSIMQLDTPSEAAEKRERWRRIAAESARQCGAAWLPEIDLPRPFDQVLPLLAAIKPLFVAALAPDARPLRQALASFSTPPREAAWVVGPEGDLTEAELQALRDVGGALVSLGSHVLRTETAAIYGLAVLGAAWL
jgi:16S rRNA (uracil1498-N3)-methyltransferase